MLARALQQSFRRRAGPSLSHFRHRKLDFERSRPSSIVSANQIPRKRLKEEQSIPEHNSLQDKQPFDQAAVPQSKIIGSFKKPSWMQPHLEVIGLAVKSLPTELSAKADSISRTGCLITLWELTLSLVRNLGFGYKWTVALVQLVLYATLLLPGFAQIGFGYFFRWNVNIGVSYGSQPRNFLDIYSPPGAKERSGRKLAPVIVFVTGGAWIIGYRAWGALLARRLCQQGAMVCCIDYRNFPQGTILDMLHDCDTALQWVSENIESYGGNSDDIFIVGQSAGAHISSLCLFAQAQKAAQTMAASPSDVMGPPADQQSIGDTGDTGNVQTNVESYSTSPRDPLTDRLSNSADFGVRPIQQSSTGWDQSDSESVTTDLDSPLDRLLSPDSPSQQAVWSPVEEHIATPASPPAVAALGTAALSWNLSSVRGFYGISGAYDIAELEDVLDNKGLHRSLLKRIMNVSALGSLDGVSPTRVLAGLPPAARALLPPFSILHGSNDKSVPLHIAEEFADELQAAGLLMSLDMRQGKSHTQVFIEDPFKGDDYMCDGITSMVFDRKDQVPCRPLLFKWVIDAASFCCPF